jgi:hypothetical protein
MLGIFEKYYGAITHYYFPKLLKKGKGKNNNIKWPLDTFLSHLKRKVLTTNFIFLELSKKEKI